jgi:uncharacterized membrane protein YhaH (DUF805 family)
MNYETLFTNPTGRTARDPYLGALVPLLAALTFYYFLVRGPSGQIGMLIMLVPATILHVRRMRDMGRPVWLLALPAGLLVVAFWLHYASPDDPLTTPISLVAAAVSALFVAWSLIGQSRA